MVARRRVGIGAMFMMMKIRMIRTDHTTLMILLKSGTKLTNPICDVKMLTMRIVGGVMTMISGAFVVKCGVTCAANAQISLLVLVTTKTCIAPTCAITLEKKSAVNSRNRNLKFAANVDSLADQSQCMRQMGYILEC